MLHLFDVIIAGGGLSGLTSSLILSENFKVLLIDTDEYPRHKLCGEYLSNEVFDVLTDLGVSPYDLGAVSINQLDYTFNHKKLSCILPLGGIGISRYTLDQALFNQFQKEENATFLQGKVTAVTQNNDQFTITCGDETFTSKQFIMATGKRSLLDKKLERSFIKTKSPWLAVKMHYDYDMPDDLVGLHTFDGGYAGISKVENNKVNLCYLATYDSFKEFKDVDLFNKEVLSENTSLKHFFDHATACWEKPITISQISFDQKQPVENNIIMVGDTAGLIHPLCGNGMAMAIHSAVLASKAITPFLENKINRHSALVNYSKQWNHHFKSRLKMGRWLQTILLNPNYTRIAYRLLGWFPWMLPIIIKRTHGKPVKL